MDQLAHILYVDDEEHNLTAFRATFRRAFNVHTALSASEGAALLKEHPIEVIITDQRMPGMTGVEFLEQILGEHPDPIRMVLTGFADMESIIDAINKGEVYRYITKPWEESELKMVLDSAVEMFRLRSENKRLMEHLARYNEELERTVAQRTAELEASTRSVVEQNKQITQLNREKADMLQLAGEDLQHPLRDILRTAAHGIEKRNKLSGDDAESHFQTIRNAATRIQSVIENLMLLNAIEKSGIKVFPTHLDAGMIAQTVVMGQHGIASAKNITVNLDRKGFGMAHTDPTGLQTILEHLVSNAVKFSPSGSTVTVTVEPADGGVNLGVIDHGPGFTADDVATLYTKFATHSAKPTGGELTTGLGLNIVKNYVDALQGTIALSETPGSGATFTVALPSLHR
ncbi:MAG: hybrid sensor histidine kinase/response regulator [Ignavibacteriae bacterium]|nr:MAG: hybrid sensor histidine kinase/response regulator [Ignavibacteriota bacterium]